MNVDIETIVGSSASHVYAEVFCVECCYGHDYPAAFPGWRRLHNRHNNWLGLSWFFGLVVLEAASK
jgi:hypothetical protein